MNIMSIGNIKVYLIERLIPLASCHATSPTSVEASKRGRSAGVSPDDFVSASARRDLFVAEKHKQPD